MTVKSQKHHSAAYNIWRALRSNRVAVICMLIIGVFILISIFADVMFDYDTDVIEQHLDEDLLAPSMQHLFGTDALGRDYFARMLYATRITLIIAFSSVFIALAISLLLGGV